MEVSCVLSHGEIASRGKQLKSRRFRSKRVNRESVGNYQPLIAISRSHVCSVPLSWIILHFRVQRHFFSFPSFRAFFEFSFTNSLSEQRNGVNDERSSSLNMLLPITVAPLRAALTLDGRAIGSYRPRLCAYQVSRG